MTLGDPIGENERLLLAAVRELTTASAEALASRVDFDIGASLSFLISRELIEPVSAGSSVHYRLTPNGEWRSR